MSDESPRLMIIDAEHLGAATRQNIHLVRWPNEPERIEATVRQAAAALGHHAVVLDGRSLQADDGSFGSHERIFSPPPASKGIVVFLREPEPFMRGDLLQFALFFQELSERSQRALDEGIAISVILGPLPEDSSYEGFMSCFTSAKHFCEACQRVDPREILDPDFYYVDCR